MTDNNKHVAKRRKVENYELYDLLNLNERNEEDRKKLDNDAVIRVVQQKPKLAAQEYSFSLYDSCVPLIKAIMLRAPVEVIDALCCPEALSWTTRALHEALKHSASYDVIALLLEKQPNAIKEKDSRDFTILHVACYDRAPLEIVSLLLDRWPEATKEKTWIDDTPLHVACHVGVSVEVVSLLLDRYPEATKEKNRRGDTPLHVACWRRTRTELDVILLLLDEYPEAIQETNHCGRTPADIAERRNAPEDIQKLLSSVSNLFNDELGKETLEEIMSFFTVIQWWKGVWLVFKRHPAIAQTINLDTSVKAYFLSATGCHCKLTSMWEVIRNEQDLL
eukprot:CAMPEP_0185724854 /NCGR_PEP_ID=MMETSP1171-20130828/1223_1 /TAXON_ID=374046 /ORGANISM="Helicotheca tamensis, Strain CCMP826" /LENGTH=334 /DNA_ID=CAMNT_0028392803 /DNA_START=167 /DNA_END=1168 /DNA_ORIENTATION=-